MEKYLPPTGPLFDVELSSGARLLVDPVPGAPVAAVYLWVRVGAADEAPGEHGAAHFVEHMLFKGTERLGVGEAAARIEAVGGDLNAYTSREQTVYYAAVPGARWPEALEILLDMLLASRFDPEETERERAVILEEIRGGRDDPYSRLMDALAARTWGDHPYGRPVIGADDEVAGLGRDALMDFWRRWYTPANLMICVAGDAEPEAVRRQLEGALPVGASPPRRDPRVGGRGVEGRYPWGRRTPGVDLIEGEFEERVVEVTFPAPGPEDKDALAVELLAQLLAGGQADLLPATLQLERELVASAWAALELERGGGALSVGLSPLRGKTLEAIQALLALLAGVVRGEGLSPDALRRSKVALQASWLFDSETVDNRAHELLWSRDLFGDPRATADRSAALDGLGLEDVRRVAAQILVTSRCALAAVVPEGEIEGGAASLEALIASAADDNAAPPAPASPRPAQPSAPPARRRSPALLEPTPRVERRVLEGGATVVVEVAPGSPVAAGRFVALGGQLTERRASAGRASAWARAVCSGAGDRGAAALSAAVQELGGSVGASSGRSSQGLWGAFPSAHFEEGLSILGEILTSPRFASDQVARVLNEQREELDLIWDDPSELAWRAAQRMIFGDHPYGLPPDGTEGSLDRLGPGALRRLHRGVFTLDNLVFAASGPLDPDAICAQVESILGALPQGASSLGVRPRPNPRQRRSRWIETDHEQTSLLWAVPGARLQDPDRAPLELAAAILGGQGGRLFLSLRESRGLTYDVSARSAEGWDGGTFSAWAACEPARADEAMAALRAEVERLAETPPSDAELAAAKEATLGAQAMDRQRVHDRAAELGLWERYGVPGPSAREVLDGAIRAVSPAQISAALAARLDAAVEVRVGGAP